MICHDTIQRIKARADLVRVVEAAGVKLTRQGHWHVGLSPFHDEKTPSFKVDAEAGHWIDFSGGGHSGESSGDAIEFVMRARGLNFAEAIVELAAEFGVEVESSEVADQVEASRRRQPVLDAMAAAAAWFVEALDQHPVARTYLHDRGLDDATITQHRLGYAPRDARLLDVLEARRIAREAALATGLFVVKDGVPRELLRDRVVIPYTRAGRIVGFTGRALGTAEPKHLRSATHSDTHSHVSADLPGAIPFGAEALRSGAGTLVLCEGPFDALAADQAARRAGERPAWAAMAVGLTMSHADRERYAPELARFRVVVILFDAEPDKPDGTNPGRDGARRLGQDLHRRGVPVRIGALPMPTDAKRDIADFCREGGDLGAVIDAARPWLDYCVDAMPASLDASGLQTQIETLAPDLLGVPDLHFDELAVALKKRAPSIDKRTIRRALRVAARASAGSQTARQTSRVARQTNAAAEGAGTPGPAADDLEVQGRVIVVGDRYVRVTGDQPTAISTFRLEPRRLLVVDRDEGARASDTFTVDVICESGQVIRNHRLPVAAFGTRRALIAALPNADAQFMGSDDHAQFVLHLVTTATPERVRGTGIIGRAWSGEVPVWVGPHDLLTPFDVEAPERIVHVDPEGEIARKVKLPTATNEVQRQAAQALPVLLALNTPQVILPALGWFAASLLRPAIVAEVGAFPFLCVVGTQGSGKSTLAGILLSLFGMGGGRMSAQDTPHAMMARLASTNAAPVCLDEHKPGDMRPALLDHLNRSLREAYDGVYHAKGNRDQSVNLYRIQAPIALLGEAVPTDSAVRDRMVLVTADANEVMKPARHAAKEQALAARFEVLARPYIRFTLGEDVAAGLKTARREVEQLRASIDATARNRPALAAAIVAYGLDVFQRFAATWNVALDLDRGVAIRAVLHSATLADNKSGLDLFLEQLAAAAGSERSGAAGYSLLDAGCDRLYFNVQLAVGAYREHLKRTDWRGETLDKAAVNRQAAENHARGGYVVRIGQRMRLDGRQLRVIEIDTKAAEAAGIDLDGFRECATSP